MRLLLGNPQTEKMRAETTYIQILLKQGDFKQGSTMISWSLPRRHWLPWRKESGRARLGAEVTEREGLEDTEERRYGCQAPLNA